MTGADATVTVDEQDASLRLDRWFKRHYPGLGHGRLEKLLRTGQIRVDGKRARAGDRIEPGQAIRVPPLSGSTAPAQPRPQRPRPADEALLQAAILHRDEAVIVLNKPPGLAVQGGTATERHLDGLLDSLRFGNSERPRLVHRLDKAKTPGPGGERVRPDSEEGRHAVTYYCVIDNAGTQVSWLALMPITGRTHQLRAHCAAIGTPILGDGKYGGVAAHLAGVPGSSRLHLHARNLAMPHPLGGTLEVTAPLPPHMRRSWEFFGFADDIRDSFADLELRV